MQSTGAEGHSGFPELSRLGKRVELLRIERGLSKQQLARYAGTSRQQLWRVVTGKSELTPSLRERLAAVLRVDARELTDTDEVLRGPRLVVADSPLEVAPRRPMSVADYLASADAIARTLATFPDGEGGRTLRRAFLNCIEEHAAQEGMRLPAEFFALRGRVVNGEL